MKWYWWVIIGFAVTVCALYYLNRKRQTEYVTLLQKNIEMGKTFTPEDAILALVKVAKVYGKDTATEIEKVARLETSHFTSKQYKLTGTGGMEAHGSGPYYGWFAPFFVSHPEYTPVGTTNMLENKGASAIPGANQQSTKQKVFVIMPSTEAWMMFLADYAHRHKNEGGIARWYSTDQTAQNIYRNSLAGISTPFTNSIQA